MNTPTYCEVCNHPLIVFEEYGKRFCPECEKAQLARFSLWAKQQKSSESVQKKEETEHSLEEEIKQQEHINKVALQTVLLKHIEECKQKTDERPEYFEGKLTAYQEILRLVVSDSDMVLKEK